jgi:predicted aldo/keto reductase-like oxidoreductase
LTGVTNDIYWNTNHSLEGRAMNYRTFGKLDWKASALGFGAMRLPVIGNDPTAVDAQLAIAMIRTGIDGGINYIDTAYPYHGGNSEVVVGRALQDGYRQRVHLATKMPSWLINSQNDMTRYFDEQLRRLGTDHVDLYLLHGLTADRWHRLAAAGVLEWAEARIQDGTVGSLGFSFHDTNSVFHEIVDAYDRWGFCQIQYNFLDELTQAGTEGLQYAASKGLAVVVMEPLRGGKLANPSPSVATLWDSSPVRRSPAEWALDWVWNHPEVSLVLSGMSTMAQVKQNLLYADASHPGMLSSDEVALVAEVRDAYNALIRVPCTSCRYCMPCPQGVNIPGVFQLVNDGSMFGTMALQRDKYKAMKADNSSVDSCIQCRLCELACPQHISIPEQLAACAAELG